MKFFSEEDYRKTQISGMLAFPLTREGWDEYLEFMREIGVDYEQQAQKSLTCNREKMLALLPSCLHPYVHDGKEIRSEKVESLFVFKSGSITKQRDEA